MMSDWLPPTDRPLSRWESEQYQWSLQDEWQQKMAIGRARLAATTPRSISAVAALIIVGVVVFALLAGSVVLLAWLVKTYYVDGYIAACRKLAS